MEKIGLFCSDLDGSLLNSRGEISAGTRDAIRAAQERGVVCAIASGRTSGNVLLLLRDAGLRCPIAAINGALITDEDGRVLTEREMKRETAAAVWRVLSSMKLEVAIMGRGFLCTGSDDYVHPTELQFGDRLERLGQHFLRGPEAAEKCVAGGTVFKFFINDVRDRAAVSEGLGDVPGLFITRSGRSNMEIMPEGVDKASGVAWLARHYGVDMQNVMTLGDEMNDLSMIRAAGHGTAVENAVPEVRAAARHLAPDHDSDGAAYAIRRWILSGDNTKD